MWLQMLILLMHGSMICKPIVRCCDLCIDRPVLPRKEASRALRASQHLRGFCQLYHDGHHDNLCCIRQEVANRPMRIN